MPITSRESIRGPESKISNREQESVLVTTSRASLGHEKRLKTKNSQSPMRIPSQYHVGRKLLAYAEESENSDANSASDSGADTRRREGC